MSLAQQRRPFSALPAARLHGYGHPLYAPLLDASPAAGSAACLALPPLLASPEHHPLQLSPVQSSVVRRGGLLELPCTHDDVLYV